MESNTQKRIRLKKEGSEKVYEDDKWVVIRPFTLEASRLYGAATAWCTKSETTNSNKRGYFLQVYLKEGCVYYIIDKKKESGKLNKVFFHLTWGGKEEISDNTNNTIEIDTNTPNHIQDLIYDNWRTHLTRDKVYKQNNFKVTSKDVLTEHIPSYLVKCSIHDKFWTSILYIMILSPVILKRYICDNTYR